MSKKYFSMIHEGQVHIAPGKKVIVAEEFSQAIDGKELLEKVQADADLYRKEVALECEKLKADAELEGFEAGFQKWIERISKLEEEIQRVRQEVKGLVVPLSLKAAKKIVGREMEVSEDAISSIVGSTLASVAQSKQIIIYVNKRDREILEQKREKFKEIFEKLEMFSIQVRNDVDEGGFIVETESGVINAQLKHRWDALERAFGVFSRPSAVAEHEH